MNSLVLIFSLFAATGFALPTEPLTHPEPLTRVQRKDWCEGIKHLHLPDGSTRELEFLGYGGTGCAYKIKSYRIDDKEVVAKTYFPGRGESWELETRMLKKVEQYIDDFEDSHKRWILMNFVPGVDLRELPGLEKFVGHWKHDPRQGMQLVRDLSE
ncbi:hypothetical protein FRC02_008314 [Tulasnella sp. 418]|nr:hypothetical protein FRC02_008314 [Tulasnella sp. 418]